MASSSGVAAADCDDEGRGGTPFSCTDCDAEGQATALVQWRRPVAWRPPTATPDEPRARMHVEVL